MVNTDKTLRKVPVTLGAYARDRVPVISGLKATDWVVVGGVHLLREQQKSIQSTVKIVKFLLKREVKHEI